VSPKPHPLSFFLEWLFNLQDGDQTSAMFATESRAIPPLPELYGTEPDRHSISDWPVSTKSDATSFPLPPGDRLNA
jgi:hypothetical protein